MFENIGKTAAGVAQQFGSALGQIFELDAPSYAAMNKMPKARILSSKAQIKLLVPNFGAKEFIFPGDKEIVIGEIDEISFRKNFIVLKRWKPFGSKFEKVLVEDNGWDISWSAGKVDWSLAYLFYTAEANLSGFTGSNFGGKENTFESMGMLYNQPLFAITQTIKHYNGDVEEYVYGNVSLLSFEQTIDGDNDQIKESVTAFSPFRTTSLAFDEVDRSKITDRVTHIIASMQMMNKMS